MVKRWLVLGAVAVAIAQPCSAGLAQADRAGADAVAFGRVFDEVVALARREYWDPEHLEWEAWAERYRAQAVAAADRASFDAVMGRMIRALADDHSSWLGLPDARGEDEIAPGNEMGPPRLGVQFSFVAGRGLVVERVFPGTPADAAGLRRGDVIVAVDGMRLAERRGLADASGTLAEAIAAGPVQLLVERRRSRFDVEVEGDTVLFGDVAAVPYGTMLDPFTGYLAVPTFNAPGVGVAAHRALADLRERGAVALVLDLRGNQGGRLVEAGLLLGAFVSGPWAEAVARGEVAWRGTTERIGDDLVSLLVRPSEEVLGAARTSRPVAWREPLVVLVDAGTVSAGEVVALALQDHGRAAVVGVPTSGNVEAVQGFSLMDGSRVLLAVADMRGAHGLVYADGVIPDVVARSERADLARGLDLPLVEARRLLGGLPFTPDRRFRRRAALPPSRRGWQRSRMNGVLDQGSAPSSGARDTLPDAAPRAVRRGPKPAPQMAGAPDRIRTCGLSLRRRTLYPTELRAPEQPPT